MSSYQLKRARQKLADAEVLLREARAFKMKAELLIGLDEDELKMFRDVVRRAGNIVTNRRANLSRLEQQLMEQ